MQSTQKTKAIILRREQFLENNSRVFVFSESFGKIDLVARGTQKLSSKLASHIEPLNLCDIMVIKGKQYDYLGSCVSENVFINIKNNYEKSLVASETARLVDEMIKGRERDEKIFLMLKSFLEILNSVDTRHGVSLQVVQSAFLLKLIAMLGYSPNLKNLQIGNMKINKTTAEILQNLLEKKFSEVLKLNLPGSEVKKTKEIILRYKNYIFD